MKITKLKPRDVIFIEVPTANLPHSKAKELLEEVKDAFKRQFDNPLFVLGSSTAKKTKVNIIRRER